MNHFQFEKNVTVIKNSTQFYAEMGNSQDKLTSEQRNLWEAAKQEKVQLTSKNVKLEKLCLEYVQKIGETNQKNDELLQQIESLKRDLASKEEQTKESVTIADCRAWINEVTKDSSDITEKDKQVKKQTNKQTNE